MMRFFCLLTILFCANITECGNVTSLEVAVGESNIIKLESGQSALVRLVYVDTSSSNYTFSAALHTGETLDTSSAFINSISRTIDYVIHSSIMSSLSYGGYIVNFTLTGDDDSTAVKSLVVKYEERISNLMILTNISTFLVNQEVIFEASITNGSNVVTEWTWGVRSCIYAVQGNGSRTFPANINFTEAGQLNLTVVAFNAVSNYSTFVVVDVYHEINSISLNCPFKIWNNETANITMKMAASAKIPQGTLKAELVYDDDSEADIIDLYTQLSKLNSLGVVIPKWFNTSGNYTVRSRVFTEVDERNLSCEILVCEKRRVSLLFERYVKYNTPVLFDFMNKPSVNFIFNVDFGDNTTHESSDTVLNERYSIKPFYKSYNTSGVYNITSVTCSSCDCLFDCYVISILTGITSFDVANGSSNFIKIPEGGSSTVHLEYDTPDVASNYSLSAGILSGPTLNTPDNYIVDSSKRVTFTVASSSINSLEYGTYELTLNLTQRIDNFVDTYSKDLIVHYEEPITTIELSASPHVVIGETSFFNVTLDGSNVETDWLFDLNETCHYEHDGHGLRIINFNFTLLIGGSVNISVIASNTISQGVANAMLIALHRISGLTFITSPGSLFETKQTVTFKFILDPMAVQPQGNINATIDFSDGSPREEYHIYNETSLTTMRVNGSQLQHVFNKQGNFSVITTLNTEVDTKQFTTNVYVWDKLDNVSLTCSQIYVEVKEDISFSFSNPPNSNFQYLIEYGDGSSKNNSASDLFENYSLGTPWNKSYDSPNVYSVRTTIFNPFYTQRTTLVIKVEHPILPQAFHLSPTTDAIPVPDGNEVFTLSYQSSEPPPTDIVCTFDFGDGYLETNVSSVISNNSPIIKSHTYEVSGRYRVQFSCFNRVSSMYKSSDIVVQSYVMSDFEINYGNNVKLMNMTTIPFKPDATYRHTAISKPIPVNVDFHISLKNCSRMPLNITVKWDFDDERIEYGVQNSFLKSHEFTQRKNHSMKFTFIYTVDDTRHSFYYWLQMGLVKFTVDEHVGLVSEKYFHFSAVGMDNAIYTFDPDSKNSVMKPSPDGDAANVTYNAYGTFLPKVTARNSTVTEVVYLVDTVKADFALQKELSISVSNTTVLLPPGRTNISVVSNTDLPFVTCTFTSGDLIDRKVYSQTANITTTKPMVFNYKYLTLGRHVLIFNCSNYVEVLILTNFTLLVHNPCFTYHGIFDRKYALYENAMKAYTSKDVYVSSRMQVICSGKTPGFEWKMFKCPNADTKELYNYTSPFRPLQGTNVFPRGRISPGIYLISLNVTLDETWIKENMYIEFIKPPPYAFIIGGSKRPVKLVDKTVEVDAFTGSYDGATGYGNNKYLSFSFECKMFSSNDYQTIEDSFNNDASTGYCTLKGVESGKGSLNVTTAKGYAVTVNVSDGQKFSIFTQFLSILDGNPPNMILNCSINCAEKYAITAKMNVYAQCLDCHPGETLQYSWSLWKLTEGTENEVLDFDEKSATGLHTATMVIKDNSFESGVHYVLKLNTSSLAIGRLGFSVIAMDIKTNYPPYNGHCEVQPQEGRAMKDSFNVICEDWVDEGSRDAQQLLVDREAQEPLVYLYEIVTKSNVSGVIEESTNEIYSGGESSAINMVLPLGRKEFNYTMDIRVQIFDRFGDYSTTTTQVTVKPLENVIPQNSQDTAAVNGLFDSFSEVFNTTQAGGNSMAVVRLVNSALSYFQGSNKTSVDTDDDQVAVSPVTQLYQEKAVEMAEILMKSVSPTQNNASDKALSPADTQQVSSTLVSITKNSEYITTHSAEIATKVAKTVMKNVLQNAEILPFPVEITKSIAGAVSGTLIYLDKIMDTLLPEEVYDYDEEETEDSIYEELFEEYKRESQIVGSNITVTLEDLRETARIKYNKRKRSRERQEQSANFGRMTAKIIEQLLKDMEKVSILQQEVGEGPKTLHQGDIDVVTEVARLDDIVSRNQSQYQDIQLQIVEEDDNAYANYTPSSWNITAQTTTATNTTSSTTTTTTTTTINPTSSSLSSTVTTTTTSFPTTTITTTNPTSSSLSSTVPTTTTTTTIHPTSPSLHTLSSTVTTTTTTTSSSSNTTTNTTATINPTNPSLHNLSTTPDWFNSTTSSTPNNGTRTNSSKTNLNPIIKMQIFLEKNSDHISCVLEKKTVDEDCNLHHYSYLNSELPLFGECKCNAPMSVIKKNPYMHGANSSGITYPVISVHLEGNVTPIVKFKNKVPVYRQMQRYSPKTIPNDPERFFYFKVKVRNDDDYILLCVKPENINNNINNINLYTVFISKETYPREAEGKHDWQQKLSLRDWTVNGLKIIIPPYTCVKGTCYVGLQPVEAKTNNDRGTKSRKRRSVLETTTSDSGNGSTSIITTTTFPEADVTTQNSSLPVFNPSLANFSLAIATTGCRTWDEEQEAWVSNGCKVLESSTLEETNCRCERSKSRGLVFATTFYVPPNVIHFGNILDKMDAENSSVYGTLLCLLILTIVLILFLRRKDKNDLAKWSIHFLVDSNAADDYFYLISVHTGFRRGAGTRSNVSFVLVGDEHDTGIRLLTDGITKGFETSSVRQFFMGSEVPLGELTYLRIWHDNAGSGDLQSWYLNKVVIDDVQTHTRFIFLCERWLAVDDDDGQVERIVPVCGQENLMSFNNLFSQHAQRSITDNHLWLSIVLRPQRSNFTRVQRLICLTSFLFLTMLTNALFFKSAENEKNTNDVKIGFMRFSLTNLFTSIQSIAITTPPIVFVIIIYRNSRRNLRFHHAEKVNEKILHFIERDTKSMTISPADDAIIESRLPLPHWTIYIAWTVNILAILGSTFYLFLISMQWGKAKSEDWLTTFLLSFMESFFIVDPLKVVIIAVLLSLVFKRSPDSDVPSVSINKLRERVSSYKANIQRSEIAFFQDFMNPNQESIQTDLQELRKKRKQETNAKEALFTLLSYALFMFVIYSISYIERDQRSYHLKTNIQNHLFGNAIKSKMNKTEDFYVWMNEVFIPIYYPITNYANKPLNSIDKMSFGDMANIRVGPGRIRQVRMKKVRCDYNTLTWPHLCIDKYSEYDEDDDKYCVGWTTYNASKCKTNNNLVSEEAWKFTKSSDIWGSLITGEYNTYGGGGYILKFTKNREQAELMMKQIEEQNWIDRRTRAIIVEFTLYNGNTHLFTYVIFISEMTETGGVFNWVEIRPFRPLLSLDSLGTYSVFCYMLFVVYQLILTVQTINGIRKEGFWSYFKILWNIVDALCLGLDYFAVGAFATRLVYANKAMDMFYDDLGTIGDDRFVNFNHIVIWDQTYTAVVAVLVFIATLRIIRILGYNRKFTELASVISKAANELVSFGVVFTFAYFAFVFCGHLLFGKSLQEYRSVFQTWSTLTNALIGKNSLKRMTLASPYFAQAYYFTYVFFVLFTLVTVFAAILNTSITCVRKETASVGDIYGILDMFMKTFSGVLKMVIKQKRRPEPKSLNKTIHKTKSCARLDTPNVLRLIRGTFGDFQTLEELSDKPINGDKTDKCVASGKSRKYIECPRVDSGGVPPEETHRHVPPEETHRHALLQFDSGNGDTKEIPNVML